MSGRAPSRGLLLAGIAALIVWAPLPSSFEHTVGVAPLSAQAPSPVTLPLSYVDISYTLPTGCTTIPVGTVPSGACKIITVAAGQSFQTALNQARRGDIIQLAANASFVGPFELPDKGAGTDWVYIVSSALGNLPGPGNRLNPNLGGTCGAEGALPCGVTPNASLSDLPKIMSGGGTPPRWITTAHGADRYRFIGIEFRATPGEQVTAGVRLHETYWGTPHSTLSEKTSDIILDRCLMRGNRTAPYAGRAVIINGDRHAVINSYLSDWVDDDSDTQAVLMHGYASVFAVINNYLEATGENVYTDNVESIGGVVYIPSDGEIRGNYLRKLVEWNSRGWNNTKNQFEMKAGQRILFEGNIIDTTYHLAQETAINIKIGDEDPRKTVNNVTVRKNIIRNVANGIKMCAVSCNSFNNTNIAVGIAVYNNIFDHVSDPVFGAGGVDGNGFHHIVTGPLMFVDHNTFLNSANGVGTIFRHGGVGPSETLVITNNIWTFASNPMTAAEVAAASSIASYTNNLMVGGNCANYPAGNRCPASWAAVGFVNYNGGNGGDYTLAPGSAYKGVGSDLFGVGTTDPGANVASVNAATACAVTGVCDSTPPAVSLTAPANGATVSGTIALSANASDNVGVAGVQFLVDGTNVGGEDTTAPYTFSWNSATVANGTHTVSARARDTAGLTTLSAVVTVTVQNVVADTTPPTVSMTAPANGAIVTGTVTVSANASDNVGVAGVQFLLDGANLGAEDSGSPFSVVWNTAAAVPGAHILTARARDAAGNTTTSAAISVTIPDTTAPTISMSAPANGATVTGTVTVSAGAADNVGVAGVQFLLDGANLNAEDTTSPYSVSWNTATASLGTHTLTARARDAAGNTTTATTITVTVPDTTAPTVSVTAPANGAVVTGTITVSAVASDNAGVLGVQFLLDGANLGAEDTSSPYAASWNTAGATLGTHTLTARARDAAGNTTTSATITVTVSDAAAPAVSLTAPANGATVTGSVTISADASDNVGVAGVQFLLDGANLGAEDTSSPYSVSWNTATATIGTHTLTARARDAAGNTTTSAAITVTVPDTTAPTVSISAPANGATVTGTVTVSANASDNAGVVGVQFLLDGGNLGAEDTTSPYSVSWNTTTATIGSHTLTARARDAAGNTTTSAIITVTVPDTAAPTVSLTAPANGATVTGTVTVSANASDNVGVAGVQFQLDGANLGAEDTSNPFSVSWNTATAGAGSHTLTAVARDAAGNTTTSAIITVTVPDTSAPTVSITAPANGATVSGTVPVTATTTDNVGVVGVQFLLDGVNLGAEDTSSPYSASWNTAAAAIGAHTLAAVARDAAGNTTTSATITVTVPDTSAPTVSISAPANGATVTGSVTVSANASDNVGVVGVQFLLDGVNLGAEDTSSPYSVNWNTTTATIGSHTLTARARDAAGNTTTSATITVTVPDTSAPTVSISAPANGATVTGTVTVSASASDNVGVVGVQFLLDGVNLGAEDTSSPYSVSWNTATATIGSHTLTARARDAAGNTTTSAIITVTVPDTAAPTVSISAPANGATVTGTVTVSASASDNVGVVGVQFLLDGINLAAEDTSSPYSVSWNTAAAAPGTHTLTAVARDAAGNTTTSATITVTVPDTSAPTVSITAPANGATVSGTVPVTATTTDNVGVVGVQFLLDGVNLGAEDTSSPYSVSWNTATATIGSHTLTARARDAAGNTTTSATITVTVPDAAAPTVSISAPANGATVTGTVTVSANASDNVGVVGVQFLLDGVNIGAEDTSSPYSVSWNTATATIASHTLTARARDAAGNTTTSTTITVTVPDSTAPTVSLTAPTNGATVTGTVTVSANASDNVGVAGVQFQLDGANLGAEDTSSPYSVSWNAATATTGSHTLTAVARDAAGNTTTSTTITVTVPDSTAPTVSLTAPANGATVTGTVTVSANASDNVGVVGVQFLLDGVNLAAEDTSSPYSVSWNTATAGAGSHTLTAVARDAAGNVTTSATITVTVPDASAPTVSITAPANGATVTGTVTVSANASDNVGVVGVQFLLDGVNLGAEDTSSPYSVSWNTATAGAGSHTLTARARDAAGNTTTSATVTVTVPDTSAPTVSISAPANGATVSGVVSVTAAASDNVGVAGVQFLVDGANLGVEDTSSPYSVSWSTTTVSNGSHTLTAVARDAAGNTTTSTAIVVTVQNADTTAPAVSLTAPAGGATVTGTITVAATASDNVGVAGVQFLLDGVNLGAEDTTSPYAVSWDSTTVPNGSHTLTARARDAAGNTTTSTAVVVTVQNADTTAPTVSLTAPANGASVTGTVTVSASASDNVGVAGVQFLLDGVNLGAEDTTSPYSVNWNTTTATIGSHTLTARARDAAGNTTTSTVITVTVPDTSAPTVSITAPANGATVTGTVTVSANASDNVGVVGVQFLLDGANLAAEDTNSPYSVNWNTATAGAGSHTLTAVARDAAGNTTTSATITVTVPDTSAPTVSITAPANGATVSGVVPVTATTTDNVGVVGVQFLLDGVNLGAEDTSSPYSVSWNTATAAIGSHTLTARVRDAAGNTTTSTTITVTVPDTTTPTVSVTAPANGATIVGTVTVSASAADDVGVAGVQFLLDGVNLGAEDTTSPYAVSWDSTTVPNGSHTLTARARDAAGNTTTSTAVVVTVQNADTTAPTVSLTAPANGASVTGTATVSASASDNVGVVGVQFLLDGLNLGAEDTTSPYAVSWNTATATVGTHTLTARARDAAGNTTTSTVITVTVPDTSAPTVSITAPANGATVTGTVTVSANASDNVGVVGVQFLLDGVNLAAEDTSSPYSVSWNTAIAAPGPHTLAAVARDAAGNTTISATTTVTIPDTTAPTVSLTAPANGATVGGVVSVTATTTDNVGVVGVQFLLDGVNLGAEDTTSPYAVSWNTAIAAVGTHTLAAVARDAAGNTTTSTTITVTVLDTTAPTVSLTAPANGATVTGTVAVSANASDNVGVAGVQFLLDGVNLDVEDTSSPYSVNWNTATAAPGTHTLTARARDAAGNTTTAATITVTIPDTVAPTVSLTAPTNGATVSGIVTVSATASDNVGVAGVQFRLDGVNLGAEDTTSPYSVSWNTATAAIGTRTLTAVARDAAGNTTTSATITVTVLDTSGPVVSLTAPANGATVSGSVTVSATASDNVGVAGVQFLLDGANLSAEDTTSPYSVNWNTATATVGTHTLTAVARDAAGNTTTSATITVTVPDTTVPAVSITAPANGASVTGTIAVTATASDNVGVAGVQFRLDGANLGAEDTSSPYSVSWNAATAGAGSHTLTAVARDAAGNTTTSATITVTVPDTSGPTVSITAPVNGAGVSGVIAVNATASDNVAVTGVQFLLDGLNLGSEDTTAPYSVNWNTTTVSNGSRTLTAVARDAAGNTTTSAAIVVTVQNADITLPTVTLTAPASGATVSGSVTISADASDNVGVAGVQFRLDGANLGAEVTTSPYSFNWNSTGVANGSHTLTAVARDAAGNTATAVSVTVTVNNTTPAPPGLVAAFAYNESGGLSAFDSSPTGGTATLIGATWAAGQFGSTLSTTAGGFAESTDTNAVTPPAFSTISAWVFVSSAPTEIASVVNKWDGTPEDEYLFGLTPSRNLYFSWHTTGGSTWGTPAYGEVTSTGQVPLNVWTHIAVVRSAASVTFYVNGFLASVSSPMDANPFRNGTNSLRVGSQNRGGVDRQFPGRIDELRIFTRAQTALEVQTDMDTPIGGAGDTTPPTVDVTSPPNGGIVSGTFLITADADDDVGVFGVQFKLNGVNLGAEDRTAPFTTTFGTAGLPNGLHTLTAVARDAAGNTTTSAPVTVTVQNNPPDTVPPAVSLLAPADGATVSGAVTISATASDNVGVVGVQFRVDGVNVGAEDTSSPFATSWITAIVADGAHTITAVARDAAGNTTVSAPRTVTVSNGAIIAGLVAAYAFDEGTGRTPLDSSPLGNRGTLMGGASWVPGRYGTALALNGTGFAEAVDLQALTPATSATFSAWVYLTSPPDGLSSIINKWNQSADDEYLFGVALNRRLHFAWKTTGATTWGNTSYNETTADAGQLPVGVWTHVAVVRAGTTLTFYINGDVVATAPVMDANPFRDGRNTLRIGGQGRGTVSPYFPGFIDDVRIYNRALTQEDIQRDMNTPIGGGSGEPQAK